LKNEQLNDKTRGLEQENTDLKTEIQKHEDLQSPLVEKEKSAKQECCLIL